MRHGMRREEEKGGEEVKIYINKTNRDHRLETSGNPPEGQVFHMEMKPRRDFSPAPCSHQQQERQSQEPGRPGARTFTVSLIPT